MNEQMHAEENLARIDSGQVFGELWVSLASLLRSYTAAHGLNGNRQATVELGERLITVRHGERWLRLERDGSRVEWQRHNGSEVAQGVLELTVDGRLKDLGSKHEMNEDEMDLKAEEWARELMK